MKKNPSAAFELPEIIFARKVAYASCYSRNWHAIKEHQIFHLLKGKITLELESGLSYAAAPGDTLFLPANVRHRDRFHESEPPELIHLRFLWQEAEHFFAHATPDCISRFAPSVKADISAMFKLLHLPSHRMDGNFNSPIQRRRVTLQLGAILGYCMEQFFAPFEEFPDPGESRFDEICRYIEDQLETPLSLTNTAAYLRISPRTLSRLFRQHAKSSFHAYLLSRKMERAREMLEAKKHTLSEIAFALGFSDPAYFGKVFKKHFSVTPGKFK